MNNFLRFILIVLILFTGFTGCKKLTEFSFLIETDASIPASNPLNLPFDVFTPPVTTNTEATFDNEDTKASLVEKIQLSSCKISITSPAGRDFSFLNEVHLWISAGTLQEKEIAWKTAISDTTGAILNLEVSGLNLRDYLVEKQIKFRLSTTTDKIISGQTDVHLETGFGVKAKLR